MPEPATIPLKPAEPAKPLLLNQAEAMAHVGLPRSTWFRLRAAGKLPDPVDVPGGALYWRTADLDRWTSRLKPSRRRRRTGRAINRTGEQPVDAGRMDGPQSEPVIALGTW